MRVFCPYTEISPATRAALDSSGCEWIEAEVAGDAGYWMLLDWLWQQGEDFAIVEHDVIPAAGALASFEACGNDWCSCPYPYLAGTYAGLGCTRFRARIMATHPDLMEVVAGISTDENHPPKHWCRLDAYMRNALMQRGERQCVSHPEVGHPSRSPSHGCVPGYPSRR